MKSPILRKLSFLTHPQSQPQSLRTEIIGGITTFLTMCYIVIVNPIILHDGGIPFNGALTATVFVCATMSILMGFVSKLPFAIGPGMGINAFFTYTLIIGKNIEWPVALGIVFWSGVIFLLISVTPVRTKIAQALPTQIRHATACGIGLFLAFIGLKNIGLIQSSPATLVTLGKIQAEQVLFILGLFLIFILSLKKSTLSIIVGIVVVTFLGNIFGLTPLPTSWFSTPDFSSVFFKLDLLGSLKLAFVPSILAIMLTDLFDSISTFVGVSQNAKMLDNNGEPLQLKEGLLVDAVATLVSGVSGTSSGTAFVESAAGVEAGARSGIAAIVTGLCFIPCFFLAPIAGAIPNYAVAPALLFVGSLMFRSIRELKLDKLEELIPAFLVVLLIPLTFSITQGMLWGILAHVFLYIIAGRLKELSPWTYAIAALSILLIAIEN